MCTQWPGHVTRAISVVVYVACMRVVLASVDLFICHKDCAGAILYSTERAIEVAMEGMQCLGGNGYINGQYCRIATFIYIPDKVFRVPHG